MGVAYQRGMVLYHQRRFAMAVEEFRRELQEVPANAWAHGMLAFCLAGDQKFDEAIASAQRGIEAAPQLPFAHYALATAVVRKPWQRPMRLFRLSSRSADRSRYVKQLKRGRKSCLEAIRLNPSYADALGFLAAIEFDLQRFRQSLDASERGLRADPNHVFCANIRGRALHELGEWDAAHNALDRALTVNPESEITHTSRGWLRLGLGDPAGAIQHSPRRCAWIPIPRGRRKGCDRRSSQTAPSCGRCICFCSGQCEPSDAGGCASD